MDNIHYESDEEATSYPACDDDEVEEDIPEDDEVDEFGETRTREENYILLKEEEIGKLQEDYFTEGSTVLSISKSDACLLLPHFHWRVQDLQDEWFADEDKVREKAGLLKKPIVEHSASPNLKITCGICFDEYNFSSKILTAACGHPYCRDCWTGYSSTSISDGGPACLMLRCPEPSCSGAVDPDLIQKVLVVKTLYDKYKRYLLRSYVEDDRKIKWCPAPNCDYAIQFDALGGMVSYDVSCLCSHSYCWNCTEENHRPVDCETVKNWLLKNKDDSQNGKWIMVNTKPCPKCNRSIEKNIGCNHMTCSAPCYYNFCWYCLGPFKSGCGCNGFYRDDTDKSKGVWGVAETDRRKEKRDLERYIHYYERWANNGRSKQKAVEDFDRVKTLQLKLLGNLQKNTAEHEYSFVIDAWQQIIECRQVLRWTYAYGYYMSEEDDHSKRDFFECLQGHAEYSLERLHNCAESQLQQFLVEANDIKDPKFLDFRKRLAGLTKVTGNYFNKLATALEEGLPEIEIGSKTKKRKGFPEYETEIQSTRLTKKRKGFPAEIYSRNTSHNWSCESCTYVNPVSSSRCHMCNTEGGEGRWSCESCTFLNPGSTNRCAMCSDA